MKTSILEKRSEKETVVVGADITVRHLREWLDSLPEEFQDVPFESTMGGMPHTLKRIVAYRSKDGSCKGVVTNPMGSHLPFDDSLEWAHVLS